ncbi:PREDICTED: uncharacterized protein LOC105567991 isoform X2 [Vollenhovia emeryi]|nr:PREDICTED: uncharacterized protein LOC105567991 isoform X2 [Vollenhovia emeryi]
MRILRHISMDNKNSTMLDYCQIYLNLNCGVINMGRNLVTQNDEFYWNQKFNQQNIEIKNYFSNTPELSKTLMRRTNLRGYTETNFETDANVTGVAINIFGNLTRAALVIPTGRMVERPGVVMSLASTYNTKGVAVGARNLPGRWYVKLTGVENSKYDFDVIAYYAANKEDSIRDDITDTDFTNDEKRITQNKPTTIINKAKLNELEQNTRKNTDNSTLLMNPTINRKRKFVFERSAEIMDSRKGSDETMTDGFSGISVSSRDSTATIDKKIINFALYNNSFMSYGEFKILPNASNIKRDQRLSIRPKDQKIQARSSEVSSLIEDVDTKIKSSISETVRMQMADSDQSQKFSTQIYNANEEPFERRKILLDLNANSKLIAAPGSTHRIIFDATNNCVLPVRYVIQARSSPFRIYNIQPTYMWLYPGQTDQVAVDILIPSGSQDTVNTLTVQIVGTEISEKTVNVYAQNVYSKNVDNVKPTIEYSFNSNCAGKQNKDYCEKTLWSADITVQDYDSGLKHVAAIPNRIYPRTKYVSGTKDRVTFYYWSTCCTPTATITAIDILENQYTRTIDVNAWDNLSQGEIAAIVLGALFLLFLLILLVVAIVFCVRKRNSHDLPYSQRYGTARQPARAERTSF